MKPTSYHQRFYTTPHYAAADATPPMFAVRLMPLTARTPHAVGNYAGLRQRSALSRARRRTNAS